MIRRAIDSGIRLHRCALTPTAKELRHLAAIQTHCFPHDDPYPFVSAHADRWIQWWLAYNARNEIAGYCGSRYWPLDNCVYLCRAGVAVGERGRGLHRRLIHVRLRHARAIGARGCYTYTVPGNAASGNNLVDAGFRLWSPEYAWEGDGVCYWWRACK